MYAWVSVAHMFTPLGNMGISQIPNEAALVADMQRTLGGKDGLYFYPWVDPNDPKMMEKYDAILKNSASGLLLYHKPGASAGMSGPLVYEFVKELVEMLIAAFLVGWAGIGAYAGRAGFVTLMGIAVSISTNASYWIWYKFPCDYTLACIAITLIGYFAGGLVIAAVLRKKDTAAPAAA